MRPTHLTGVFYFCLRWIGLAAVIGVCAGVASACFLISLDFATALRLSHPWLIYGLPLGGFVAGFLYHRFGREVEAGNNLIIDQFHEPTATIPWRMAPLVLIGTLITHLCGGSAGREGTAVQMGASLADQWAKVFQFAREGRAVLLMAGMSAGFGSVFGVPFAGMIFGLEVLAVGRLQASALIQCAVAACVAHYTTLSLGIQHTVYQAPPLPGWDWLALMSIAASGLVFGCAARLFGGLSEQISHYSKAWLPSLPQRAAFGGLLLLLLYLALPELGRYGGLGVPVISESLRLPVHAYDWFGKLVMTALTLGFGFKGGEVTPLLFIGATLGNALSTFLPVPLELLSALGLVAVFAGAANTPITCTIMAMELFGSSILPYAAIACFASFLASSHHGIYPAQRVPYAKRVYISRTFMVLRGLPRRLRRFAKH